MTDHAELIERLRRVSDCDAPAWAYDEIGDAADALAALVVERGALAAEVARMREALEPFAAEYDYWCKDVPPRLMLSDGEGTLSPADISWDAIVRARAALAQGGEK